MFDLAQEYQALVRKMVRNVLLVMSGNPVTVIEHIDVICFDQSERLNFHLYTGSMASSMCCYGELLISIYKFECSSWWCAQTFYFIFSTTSAIWCKATVYCMVGLCTDENRSLVVNHTCLLPCMQLVFVQNSFELFWICAASSVLMFLVLFYFSIYIFYNYLGACLSKVGFNVCGVKM